MCISDFAAGGTPITQMIDARAVRFTVDLGMKDIGMKDIGVGSSANKFFERNHSNKSD
jgi:hypothetical protein